MTYKCVCSKCAKIVELPVMLPNDGIPFYCERCWYIIQTGERKPS